MPVEMVQNLVWLILAFLGYLLVTCFFTVLSYNRKRAVEIHDRVRECMELRRKYAAGQTRTAPSK